MTNTTEQALRDAQEFEREERYLVFKISDINRYLPTEQVDGLRSLAQLIDAKRIFTDGKKAFECLVVESDWPEYEPTWQAIEQRMTGGPTSLPPAEQEPVAFDYKQAIGSKNCMQCSVAYMLGLPVDSVPDFEEQSQRGIPSYDSMECFIESQGFGLVMLPGTSQPECDYLASGKTKRGTSHMVVMNSGHLVHDPHPSDDGLDAVSCIWLITCKAGCTTQTTNHAPTPHPAEVREVSVQPVPSGEPVCYAHINNAGRVRAVLGDPRGPINTPLYTALQAPSVPDEVRKDAEEK